MAKGIQADLRNLLKLRYQAKQLVQTWRQAGTSHLSGAHVSHIKGRGMDFDEVRYYRAGDDIRLMDWKVTARTGEPHIKIYREEKERPVFMLVDQTSSMFFGSKAALKSVMAAEVAALLGWKSLLQHDRLACILMEDNANHFFTPSSKEQSFLNFLRKLSGIQPTPPRPKEKDCLEKGLEQLRKVVKPRALVHIISDFYGFNQDALRHLTRLSQHAKVSVFLIRDNLEKKLFPISNFAITDGLKELSINLKNPQVRKKLQESLNTELELLKHIFKKHGIQYFLLEPSDNALLKLRGENR